MAQLQQQKKKQNDTRSQYFQLQQIRRANISLFVLERHVLLSLFYGEHIDSGLMSLRRFNKMTMYDINSELMFRKNRLEGQNKARVKHHTEEEERKVKDLLEKLKQR